jgi:hypothetical protein
MNLTKNISRIGNLGDLGMDGRNILKLLLHKEDMRMWAGSIRLRIEFSRGPCDHGN